MISEEEQVQKSADTLQSATDKNDEICDQLKRRYETPDARDLCRIDKVVREDDPFICPYRSLEK